MDKDTREVILDYVNFGLQCAAAIGTFKIIRNLTPYESPFGAACCYISGLFLSVAASELIADQIVQTEDAIISMVKNGNTPTILM